MERIKLLITLDLDPETGETTCVDRQIINDDIKPLVKKSTKKSSKKADESTTPQLILEENKYSINNAAVELLGLDLDDENRLDIKMEKTGKTSIPVFGTSIAFGTPSKGNKLTKSLTVACRGKANEELSKYGSVFTIVPHPSKENLFILSSGETVAETEVATDENISIPDETLTIPAEVTDDDLDLSGLVEDGELDFTL